MTLLLFLVILGVLIIVHEFGHFLVAKKMGVRVEQFSLGFGPCLLKRRKGATEYSISAIPLGGYVKLAGDSLGEYTGGSDEYCAKAPWRRALIVCAGPLLNYVLGFLFLWAIFFVGYPTLTTKVGGLLKGFGAQNAGVQVGDRIISVDGVKVHYWEELQEAVQSKSSSTVVTLTVARGASEFPLAVTIREKAFDDILGNTRTAGLLGVQPAEEFVTVRHGFFQSCVLGLGKTWGFTLLTYKALGRMVIGKMSMRDSLTGPLGIYYITSKAATMGVTAVVHLVAILSISLAIFNLLPLPVLDGGHLMFLAIEKVRGKALGLKAEQIVTQIGLTVIIALALVATYNDIVRLFGDRIAKLLR